MFLLHRLLIGEAIVVWVMTSAELLPDFAPENAEQMKLPEESDRRMESTLKGQVFVLKGAEQVFRMRGIDPGYAKVLATGWRNLTERRMGFLECAMAVWRTALERSQWVNTIQSGTFSRRALRDGMEQRGDSFAIRGCAADVAAKSLQLGTRLWQNLRNPTTVSTISECNACNWISRHWELPLFWFILAWWTSLITL